jgi:hypothetical protein
MKDGCYFTGKALRPGTSSCLYYVSNVKEVANTASPVKETKAVKPIKAVKKEQISTMNISEKVTKAKRSKTLDGIREI